MIEIDIAFKKKSLIERLNRIPIGEIGVPEVGDSHDSEGKSDSTGLEVPTFSFFIIR